MFSCNTEERGQQGGRRRTGHVQRALTIVFRCKECGLVPKVEFMFFFEDKGSLRNITKPTPGAAVRIAVLRASTKLAPAGSPCSMVTKKRRAWSIRLSTRRRINCKSVIEALIITNHVLGDNAGSFRKEITAGCLKAQGATHWRSWQLYGRHGASMIGRQGRL